MDENWRQLIHQHERLRWARLNAKFERVKDAAISLGIKPVTYRTYEQSRADNGRIPPLTEVQRMARKFKVSWVWLLTGEGTPADGVQFSDKLAQVQEKADEIPEDKREDAWSAVMGVLDAFARKAG